MCSTKDIMWPETPALYQGGETKKSFSRSSTHRFSYQISRRLKKRHFGNAEGSPDHPPQTEPMHWQHKEGVPKDCCNTHTRTHTHTRYQLTWPVGAPECKVLYVNPPLVHLSLPFLTVLVTDRTPVKAPVCMKAAPFLKAAIYGITARFRQLFSFFYSFFISFGFFGIPQLLCFILPWLQSCVDVAQMTES